MRSLGGLLRQPSGLGHLLRRILDDLVGGLPDRLGLALSLLDLSIYLRANLLLLLLSIALGGSALALHCLVSGLLGLGDPLLDPSGRVTLRLGHAGATIVADLLSMLGILLRFLLGLDGPLLGLASPLQCLTRAPHPDFNGV